MFPWQTGFAKFAYGSMTLSPSTINVSGAKCGVYPSFTDYACVALICVLREFTAGQILLLGSAEWRAVARKKHISPSELTEDGGVEKLSA